MKYRTLSVIFLIQILFFVNSYAQPQATDALTLSKAIELTLNNQPLLQQAFEQINATEAKVKQQESYYYPRVMGDLTYIRIGPIPSIDFGGHSFELAPANNYNAEIKASQLVYDFGKRDALVDLVKSYHLSSNDKISLIKNSLSYQTILSFYTISFLNKSIEVKNEQINTLEKHLDLTKKKVQSGSATDFDILTTQVKVTDAQNQKIDIKNTLNKQEIYLKSLINWPSDTVLNISGDFKIDSSACDTETLLTRAFNMRPEMKLAQDAEKNAMLSKQVASLSDRPSLSVMASYGLKNGYVPDLNIIRGNWTAGVNASIPIFNGNLKDAKVEEAEANFKSSSANTLELKRKIKLEVEQAATDLKANQSKIKTTELQVEHARQAVNRAEVQYKDGVITNLDLIDAETSLAQAQLMYLQVVFKNVLSYYNLRMAVGNILEQ